jgi:2-polyprenyl-3-methyl-5-hydroxy-6-metoxy-1,4-benzoquinol methylase
MSVCSVISVDEFQRDPRRQQIVDEMHAMMGIAPHPFGQHCRMGHGRNRRTEIEGGKHLEYPWAIVHGDFKPGMTVLDAGCGRGAFQYYLARKGYRVSACDIDGFRSRKLLKLQRLAHGLHLAPKPDLTSRLRRNGRFFGVNVDYHIEPMQHLTWPDATFDRVCSISVLEHIQPQCEQKKAVQELARVLKSGGLMLLTLDYSEKPGSTKVDAFSPADVERMIGWSGLKPIEKPAYEIAGGWDAYLAKFSKFLGLPKLDYSYFTLILAK